LSFYKKAVITKARIDKLLKITKCQLPTIN